MIIDWFFVSQISISIVIGLTAARALSVIGCLFILWVKER